MYRHRSTIRRGQYRSACSVDAVLDDMGQLIPKSIQTRIMKKPSIYDTSVWARKYRRDFEALQLSEEQVGLMWGEFCKVRVGITEGGCSHFKKKLQPAYEHVTAISTQYMYLSMSTKQCALLDSGRKVNNALPMIPNDHLYLKTPKLGVCVRYRRVRYALLCSLRQHLPRSHG